MARDAPDGDAWQLALALPSTDRRALHGARELSSTLPIDPPLDLDLAHRDATLTLALPLSHWLDGLGVDHSDADLADTFTEHVRVHGGAVEVE